MENKNEKQCPFCEAVALQRDIEERFNKPAGQRIKLSIALVSHTVVNRRECGRITHYMKRGKGFPLKYCPSCGKQLNKAKTKEKDKQ